MDSHIIVVVIIISVDWENIKSPKVTTASVKLKNEFVFY